MNDGGELKQTPRLIARLCDGSIAPDEMEQLNRQLLADPIAMEAYIDHLEVDAMLQREFGGQPLEILPRIPSVGPRAIPSARHSLTRRLVGAAVAAALLVAFGLFLNSLWRRTDDPPFATNQPLVVQSTDDTQVRLPDGSSLPLDVGRSVRAGETIVTNEGDVLLRYDDGTEIRLSASSSLKFGESAEEGKRLELQDGVLQADVAPQSSGHELVVTTPHIAIRVLGTRFELEASESSGTRLELESGRVELDRGDQSPVAVEPGSIAIVPPDDKPIRVEPRSSKGRKPDRTVEFPWLQSVEFSDDGETLIAGTRWGAVFWHNDNRLEAVPATPRGREQGIKFKGHYGSLMVFAEFDGQQRLLVWDTVTRQVIATLEDLEATSGELRDIEVAALSPPGDWLVLRRAGRPHGEFEIHWLSGEQVEPLKCPNMATLPGSFPLRGILATPNGTMLTIPVQRDDNTIVIELISPLTGERTAALPTERFAKELLHMGFSSNGEWLALAFAESSQGSSEIQIWNIANASLVTSIANAGYRPDHLALSPDGRRVAALADSKRQVALWDVSVGRIANPSHVPEPQLLQCDDVLGATSLSFSPAGDKLAARVGGGKLVMWHLDRSPAATRRPTVIAAPDRQAQFPLLRAFDFSNDGNAVVAMTDRGAIYWQSDGELETVKANVGDDARVVKRSGSMVVFEEREPRRLVFWDAATGQTVRVVDDLDQIPTVFAFETRDDKRPQFPSLRIDVLSPRGDWMAVHKRDGTDSMHLFDLDSGRTRVIERSHPMMSYRVSPGGSMLAIGQTMGRGKDGPAATVELFAAATGETRGELVLLKGREKKAPGIVPSVLAFSADGRRLAVGVRDWLQVWDVETGERIVTIKDAEGVREIALAPTGDWVAGVRPRNGIQLWKISDPLHQIVLEPAEGCQSLMFSPDGKQVAAMLNGGRISVWDVAEE